MVDAPESAVPDRAETARRPGRRGPGWWAVRALPVVLLLAGGGFLSLGVQERDPGAAANRALVDTPATTGVIGDVSSALGKVFSYSPADTAATAQAAAQLLDGTAADQYRTLFGQVQQQVAEQKLTLSSRVVRAGVEELTADRAQLLVFLDQTAQRAGRPPTTAAAQLSVTAQLRGGHWRITELKAR
ncbi:nuclear transport factor 2 family protein [Kitasatospora kazusensis]|uniref:Nuclear transport factor 2 family protein n=1 Tax=Kitasatospora kazusensis TaxID=407974 RepID=A0ABP5KI22_9ACTN